MPGHKLIGVRTPGARKAVDRGAASLLPENPIRRKVAWDAQLDRIRPEADRAATLATFTRGPLVDERDTWRQLSAAGRRAPGRNYRTHPLTLKGRRSLKGTR
jgi:hypothetical protein